MHPLRGLVGLPQVSLCLTPEILESAYELLRRTQPFNVWRLPRPDDVVFIVTASKGLFGEHHSERQHTRFKGNHVIRISGALIGSLDTLMKVMAHEMTHMRESQLTKYTGNAHGEVFNLLADRVCRVHGFDRKAF